MEGFRPLHHLRNLYMSRVNITEVKALVDTNRDVASFIDTAHLIVNEDLANSGLSEARKKQIELYLAAHFLTLAEERGALKVSEILNAREEYGGNYTQGFNLTRFGQHAVSL